MYQDHIYKNKKNKQKIDKKIAKDTSRQPDCLGVYSKLFVIY